MKGFTNNMNIAKKCKKDVKATTLQLSQLQVSKRKERKTKQYPRK